MSSLSLKRYLLPVFLFFLIFYAAIFCGITRLYAEGNAVSRTVVVLYGMNDNERLEWTSAHQYAEMPLNFLGIRIRYLDINNGLPDLKNDSTVLGLLSWFHKETKLGKSTQYLKWVNSLVASGKKLVVIGNPGFSNDPIRVETPPYLIDRFYKHLGLQKTGFFSPLAIQATIEKKDEKIVGFEKHSLPKGYSYTGFRPIHSGIRSHLMTRLEGHPKSTSHPITTGPGGGFIASGYDLEITHQGKDEIRRWVVNPFEFFRLAFETKHIPKPDISTLAGNRIFYSHFDGDGWKNTSQIIEFDKLTAAEVVKREVLEKYADFPMTVSVIAAEMDPDWVGADKGLKVAEDVFSLPNVEPASHTYSHPNLWRFFTSTDPEIERPYLFYYEGQDWSNNEFVSLLYALLKPSELEVTTPGLQKLSYRTPRTYAKQQFLLEHELVQSIKYLKENLQSHHEIRLLTWSGDTLPTPDALQILKDLGIQNLNGGDVGFYNNFDSYAWISPIGRSVENTNQIYSMNFNENSYLVEWNKEYYGFNYFKALYEKMESPIRLKPLNIYTQIKAGINQAGLIILKKAFDYASLQEVTPVFASTFAAIAQGFYTSEISKRGENSWAILNRGELQTIRFDNQENLAPDLSRSKGIVGYKRYQGSLYVYLDKLVTVPLITLHSVERIEERLEINRPYLIQSRWPVWGVSLVGPKELRFTTSGFGKSRMRWKLPEHSTIKSTILFKSAELQREPISKLENGMLEISLDQTLEPLTIILAWE